MADTDDVLSTAPMECQETPAIAVSMEAKALASFQQLGFGDTRLVRNLVADAVDLLACYLCKRQCSLCECITDVEHDPIKWLRRDNKWQCVQTGPVGERCRAQRRLRAAVRNATTTRARESMLEQLFGLRRNELSIGFIASTGHGSDTVAGAATLSDMRLDNVSLIRTPIYRTQDVNAPVILEGCKTRRQENKERAAKRRFDHYQGKRK